jgi:hypothetical protein
MCQISRIYEDAISVNVMVSSGGSILHHDYTIEYFDFSFHVKNT